MRGRARACVWARGLARARVCWVVGERAGGGLRRKTKRGVRPDLLDVPPFSFAPVAVSTPPFRACHSYTLSEPFPSSPMASPTEAGTGAYDPRHSPYRLADEYQFPFAGDLTALLLFR